MCLDLITIYKVTAERQKANDDEEQNSVTPMVCIPLLATARHTRVRAHYWRLLAHQQHVQKKAHFSL